MKNDQLLPLLLFLIATVFITWVVAHNFDELEFLYEPETGRCGLKARKDRRLESDPPLILEGK